MIERYTLPEMGRVWSEAHKYELWCRVETMVLEANAAAGTVPADAVEPVRAARPPTPEAVEAVEAITQHDVIAFLTAWADNTTPREAAAWVHFGMTSSDLLDTALAFYGALNARIPAGTAWEEIDARLRGPAASFGIDAALWPQVQAAHVGHQLGMEILGLVPLLGAKADFFALRLGEDLTPLIPDTLRDAAQQDLAKKALAPPPQARSDEIVAAMGGVYWNREAPTLPLFVEAGSHFDKGQPLYIIEVMKMFNKVYAPFAGRIVEVFIPDNGASVRKGQPLFRVDPDEKVEVEDPAARTKRIRGNTDQYLTNLL